MSSAFRRAKKNTKSSTSASSSSSTLLGARGVKPWAGGIHLTSSGIADLDAILGGGQPLGTCILLQEDRWIRDHALSLVKYWCAEAISQDQCLVVPIFEAEEEEDEKLEINLDGFSPFDDIAADVEDLLLSLPRNLHWDKQRKKQSESSKHPAAATNPSLEILEEEEEGDGEVEEGLENAWQYRKSVQQERLAQPLDQQSNMLSSLSTTNVFCHYYDLSGRMNDQSPIVVENHLISLKISNKRDTISAGYSMFRDLVSLLKKNQGKVVRMLLFHPKLNVLKVALPLLLAHIRSNSIPVVIMICTKPTADYKSWIQLSRASDVVLSTEGFASRKEYPPPAEFRHLQGLLKISKVSTVTAPTANGGGHFADMTVSKRPAAFIYGFKRDRRKLHIPLLHIPPEDYAQGGGSTSGVRSGAGKPASTSNKKPSSTMGCASNLSGSVLDF